MRPLCSRSAWGRGYATEAARPVLVYGFDTLELPEILAVTTAANLRSQAMSRIGMTRDLDGAFEGPTAPEGPFECAVPHRTEHEEMTFPVKGPSPGCECRGCRRRRRYSRGSRPELSLEY
jgi:hypothetical protein